MRQSHDLYTMSITHCSALVCDAKTHCYEMIFNANQVMHHVGTRGQRRIVPCNERMQSIDKNSSRMQV